MKGGRNVLVRINLTNLPLVGADGNPFPLLEWSRTLVGTQVGEWDVWVHHEKTLIPDRVCVVKKNQAAAEKARRRVLAEKSRKGHLVKPETVEAAAYVFAFTTFDRSFSATTTLEMYRGRWQIELVSKRLKSIIGLGHLKKADVEAAKAWIHGKLLVAFLIEALIAAAERLFPWGYPICQEYPKAALPLAGNVIDASPS